jgi:competence ComEA-like helix-hairpin-helix protein
MSTLGQNISEYFTFTKSQRNGSLLLVGMLVLLMIVYFLMPTFIKPETSDDAGFRDELLAFEASRRTRGAKQLAPFFFDPNELPAERWPELGLSPEQVSVILNFRNKGGRFYEKEDLKKIYSISAQEYAALEPFIEIKKTEYSPVKNETERKIPFEPFSFDPNKLPGLDYPKLGLNEGQIRNIESYMNAGGKFLSKEDFKKIYSISSEDYERLEAFILLPARDSLQKPTYASREFTLPMVEINSADTSTLQNLKGVGASFAGRIIKYRDLLGGFYRKEQLLEVFGMDTARYAGFAAQIEINQSLIKRKNLNTVEFKELLKHPYLEYYLVKSIFEYKNKNGNYSSVDELRKVNLIYKELYEKISPYLFVENKK